MRNLFVAFIVMLFIGSGVLAVEIKEPKPPKMEFAVVDTLQGAIRYDVKSGKSWVLMRNIDGILYWAEIRDDAAVSID